MARIDGLNILVKSILKFPSIALTMPHQQFKNLAQPAVLSMLRKEVDKKWIDGILKAVEEASGAK